MGAGDYIRNTWQNGAGVGHPPINATNLNNIESKLEELDTLMASDFVNFRFEDYKKYFWMRNVKDIADFQDESDWTGVGCTKTGPASGAQAGNVGVYFIDSDAVGSTIYIHDTVTSINLEEFNDEEASTTSDVIVFSVDLFDFSKITDVTIKLGDDSANNYSYSWGAPAEGRQVTYQAKKSAFATNGAPAGWDDITYIQIQVTTTNNADITGYVTPMLLSMYRNDPDNDGNGQPFQYYDGSAWNNFFDQNSNLWNLLFDPKYNTLGIQCLNDFNDSDEFNALTVKQNMINFVWKSIMNCYHSDYSTSMCWYVDSNNYAVAWIDDDDFTLDVVEAGASTPYTYTLSSSLDIGELLTIKLEKNGDTIRAILEKGNDRIAIHEHETTISSTSEGDLCYGFGDYGKSLISDFMIDYRNKIDLDLWDKPKIIIKKEDETVNNSNTFQDDDELYCSLPPNSMFEIEMNLVVDAADNTPDIKIQYSTDNDISLVARRIITAPAPTTTSAHDTNIYLDGASSFTTTIEPGAPASYFANIQDKFIVATGVTGGKIALQWAQVTAHASNTVLKAKSYMKITKCDVLQNN